MKKLFLDMNSFKRKYKFLVFDISSQKCPIAAQIVGVEVVLLANRSWWSYKRTACQVVLTKFVNGFFLIDEEWLIWHEPLSAKRKWMSFPIFSHFESGFKFFKLSWMNGCKNCSENHGIDYFYFKNEKTLLHEKLHYRLSETYRLWKIE